MVGELYCFFFFFQAEDGIRDIGVTGVQTCALPILFGGDLMYCSNGSNIYNHAMIYLGKNGGRPILVHSAGPNGLVIEPTSVIGSWGCRFLPNALRYNK